MANEQDQTEEIYLYNNEGINDVKTDATATVTTTGVATNDNDEVTNERRKDNCSPSS
ncbi:MULTISPECIES: hypothetical protein [Paenibacillus]|uniref:Uncharacterized protein n=1 Tax=Paenibacillus validus TaxID=44253 RepID=A0A7X2ZCL0_9BACL|nr:MULTISPECIES: hypothetical protein [Paenibacillus]MUG72396.1 hypothetical protein [Paenibacillus validus]